MLNLEISLVESQGWTEFHSNFIKIYLYYRLIVKQWNQGCNSIAFKDQWWKDKQKNFADFFDREPWFSRSHRNYFVVFRSYDNWLAAARDTVLLGTLMWIIRLLSSGWISSSCRRHSHSFWSRSARCRSRFWKKETRLKLEYNLHISKNFDFPNCWS